MKQLIIAFISLISLNVFSQKTVELFDSKKLGEEREITISLPKSYAKETKRSYPLLVLLGFGIIDILFKKVAVFKEFNFTTSLFLIFCGAFIVSILFLIGKIIVQKEKLGMKNVLWGLALGILNFGNILFYLKAHKALSENPSTVFAGMNMGVIILGSLAGILLFKEKMTKWNYFGIILAIISIIIITLSQLK